MHDDLTAATVRNNAWSAGIAAALLIAFGYFQFLFPTPVNDAFDLGNWIFTATLRVGGVVLGVATLLLGAGVVHGLLLDGVMSALIGAGLVISGALMMFGGGAGVNPLLAVIFGAMFISAGLHNWRLYQQLQRGAQRDQHEHHEQYDQEVLSGATPTIAIPSPQSTQQDRPQPPVESPAGRLLDERRSGLSPAKGQKKQAPTNHLRDESEGEDVDSDQPTQAIEEVAELTTTVDEGTSPPKPSSPKPTPAPPPEGFLAAFAKKEPPDSSPNPA